MKNYFTEEKAKQKCEELGLEYVGYDKDNKQHTVVKYICPKHKSKGIQEAKWGHLRTAKKGCPYCIGRHITTEEAQKRVNSPYIVFTSEYLGGEKPISCHCNKCGNDWVCNRPLDLFRKNRNGCSVCANAKRGDFHRKSKESFCHDVEKNNPNVEIIGSYNLTREMIRCRCKRCGTEWESIAANIRNGSARCPYCHGTTGERRIIDFMKKYKINYLTQKTFDNCISSSKRKLRFDIYDVDNNIAFEYQGEFHYIEKPYYGDIEKGKKSLESRKIRDEIKRKFCRENNILLVEIPYWELDNIESFIFAKVELYRKKFVI